MLDNALDRMYSSNMTVQLSQEVYTMNAEHYEQEAFAMETDTGERVQVVVLPDGTLAMLAPISHTDAQDELRARCL